MQEALRWAQQRGLALHVLGGGSNIVVSDAGVDGLVVKVALRGVSSREVEGGVEVTAAAGERCGFGYRTSRFKSGEPDRFIVLSVTYRLIPGGAPSLRYADLERDLERRGVARPSLADVRASVLAIRRSKSMVLDPDDPNRRSCGSFFLNPIVDAAALAQVEQAVGDAA